MEWGLFFSKCKGGGVDLDKRVVVVKKEAVKGENVARIYCTRDE